VPEPEALVSTPAAADEDARAVLPVPFAVLDVVAVLVPLLPQPLMTMPASSAVTVMLAVGRAAALPPCRPAALPPRMIFPRISGFS
jgi:hypothetical protein